MKLIILQKKEKSGSHSLAIEPRQNLIFPRAKSTTPTLYKNFSFQNKKEKRKSLNQGELVQPDIFSGIDNYINLSSFEREGCKATVAQSGRAPASRAGVQPDIRVQTLNQDESPGSGAQKKEKKGIDGIKYLTCQGLLFYQSILLYKFFYLKNKQFQSLLNFILFNYNSHNTIFTVKNDFPY